ncbi:Lon protease [Parasponia andersonii]|uniref:Lon protease n=1 Tax=Parasponia andersonii TaxID=3476 RepID=A0A2P5E1G5_PARAD|nr:Lon protease [Parasponia andersonii]
MATSMELPLLPFPLTEVLVPSESKTLHLYEARYLALLEESFMRKSKLFVHFVLDPIMINDLSAEPSFAARYGCLVVIENVEKLDVGALVSIRGVGRIKIVEFVQADPYLKGVVKPEQDIVPESLSRLSSKVTEIKEALHSLNSLEIKLKVSTLSLSQCLLLCIF